MVAISPQPNNSTPGFTGASLPQRRGATLSTSVFTLVRGKPFVVRLVSNIYICIVYIYMHMVPFAAADTQVILSIPATPVTAGENVTLKCEARRQPSSPSATFYRNGNFFRTEPTGGTIISHVALSDEGIYKCEIAGRGDSPSSWLLVTGQFVVFL